MTASCCVSWTHHGTSDVCAAPSVSILSLIRALCATSASFVAMTTTGGRGLITSRSIAYGRHINSLKWRIHCVYGDRGLLCILQSEIKLISFFKFTITIQYRYRVCFFDHIISESIVHMYILTYINHNRCTWKKINLENSSFCGGIHFF